MNVEDDGWTSRTTRIRGYPKSGNTICVELGGFRIEGLMQLVDEVIKSFTVSEIADRFLRRRLTQPVDLAHGHAGGVLSPGGASNEKNAERKRPEGTSEWFHVFPREMSC